MVSTAEVREVLDYFSLSPEEVQERRAQALEYLRAPRSASIDGTLLLLIEKVRQLETELAELKKATLRGDKRAHQTGTGARQRRV